MAVVTCFVAFAQPLFAQNGSLRRDAGGGEPQQALVAGRAVEDVSLAEKRAWLINQMLEEFSDVDRAAEIQARVGQMSPERVDALMKIYLKREANLQQEATNEQRRNLAASDAYKQARVRDYQNRLAAARSGGGGPVGYAPVITWLPEGTSLGASAVVSPDRRYVRMSLQPFFSRIKRVDTFTFHNPGTRYPNYYNRGPAYPQYYSRGNVNYRPQQPRPIVYYDGVRTRTYYPNSPNHR
jgi:hypothetical protein